MFGNLRIKMTENFKDGNILEGKFLAVNSVHVVTERVAQLIENSGGLFEVLETVIPNPLKPKPEDTAKPAGAYSADENLKSAELSSYREEVPATGEAKAGQTVSKPRKPGRPRKS